MIKSAISKRLAGINGKCVSFMSEWTAVEGSFERWHGTGESLELCLIHQASTQCYIRASKAACISVTPNREKTGSAVVDMVGTRARSWFGGCRGAGRAKSTKFLTSAHCRPPSSPGRNRKTSLVTVVNARHFTLKPSR